MPRLTVLVIAATAALSTACDPSCQRTCRRLLECDTLYTARLSQEECEASCQDQEGLYDEWEDPDLQDRFRDYKVCVMDSTCNAIAEGECYDEELYAF